MKIFLQKLSALGREPTKGSEFAACWDLYSASEVIIPHGFTSPICTHLALQPGYADFEFRIRGRSSLSLKGILCHPGTIDSDYTGEIMAILTNLGKEPYTVKVGDRIAQISAHRVQPIEWHEVEKLLPRGERGSGGFGSTGR